MEPIIVATDLLKRFGHVTAVGGISFTVPAGTVFAFLGPNGAGKSTTIKMLTTLLMPTSGTIRLDGHDVIHDADRVRRSFGIVFQDPSLDDELTAAENMEYHGVLYGVPRTLRRQRTKELLEFVELWERRDSLVKSFSGGMKRRLEIARGLMHHPKVLFLDEPTLGLDPQTRNHIWSYIQSLNRDEGITVFFTTHYMEEAERVAGQVVIIDRGTIQASGTPADILRQAGTGNLEDAFIKLTGRSIREAEPDAWSSGRMRLWRR